MGIWSCHLCALAAQTQSHNCKVTTTFMYTCKDRIACYCHTTQAVCIWHSASSDEVCVCVCVCMCTCARVCMYVYIYRYIYIYAHTRQIICNRYAKMVNLNAEPISRTVYGVDLRLLAFWDCGFESRRGHECLSCECSVLSGWDLCDGPITLTEESYWM
jgi:hypothetical protein